MIGEMSFLGVYMPWLMPLALVALFVLHGVRRLLARAGIYRWIWHPALFDMALYVVLLYAVVQAAPFLQ